MAYIKTGTFDPKTIVKPDLNKMLEKAKVETGVDVQSLITTFSGEIYNELDHIEDKKAKLVKSLQGSADHIEKHRQCEVALRAVREACRFEVKKIEERISMHKSSLSGTGVYSPYLDELEKVLEKAEAIEPMLVRQIKDQFGWEELDAKYEWHLNRILANKKRRDEYIAAKYGGSNGS